MRWSSCAMVIRLNWAVIICVPTAPKYRWQRRSRFSRRPEGIPSWCLSMLALRFVAPVISNELILILAATFQTFFRFLHAAIWLMEKSSMVTLFQTLSSLLPLLRRMNPELPPHLRIFLRSQSASLSRKMEKVCTQSRYSEILKFALFFSVCEI